MYDFSLYGSLLRDEVRLSAYARALDHVIAARGRAATVLDLGTGTGILALLACRAGAARVYAIDEDDAIEVARQVAAAAGFGDRIVFVHARSTEAVIPERVDLIVSDLRGVLPLYKQHLRAIADARDRFLKPGGGLIPRRDAVRGSVVGAPGLRETTIGAWEHRAWGFDWDAARQLAVNQVYQGTVRPEEILLPPRTWADIDYGAVRDSAVRGHLTWTADRAGVADGLLFWFEADLAEGVGFSSAPGQPPMIYGSLFLPFERALAVAPGDRLSVAVRADPTEHDYMWTWRTRFEPSDSPAIYFDQSTFKGVPLARGRLRRA